MASPEIIERCVRLISCRSLTHEGNRAAAELCARELLGPAGIEARLIPSINEGGLQVNLLAIVHGRDHSLAPIVLNTHLDTVPPGDHKLWTECGGDPFAARIDGDRIYGLGAADTKLDFVAKAAALIAVQRPKRDVYLIGTFGEEHGLAGAKEIAAGKLLPRGAMAFVGEPSGLEIITAHKGLGAFDFDLRFEPVQLNSPIPMKKAIFIGRSAHSSTPHLGANAIRAAIDAIANHREAAVASFSGGDAVNKVPARCELTVSHELSAKLRRAAAIEQLEYPSNKLIPPRVVERLAEFIRRLSEFADSAGSIEDDYAAPTLTCNPGIIHSDDDTLSLKFEMRPPPSMSFDTVRAGLDGIVADLSREPDGIGITLRQGRANPGFRSPASSATVELAIQSLAAAGLPVKTGVKSGCTEAGIYASIGLIPIVFGPGPWAGVIHAPNEYNLLSQVEGAIRFYQEALVR
ncbi:MAG: M20 family metallopeptidase [Candidatus Binataceae bacterium]